MHQENGETSTDLRGHHHHTSIPTYRGRTLAAYRPSGALTMNAPIGALAPVEPIAAPGAADGVAEETNRAFDGTISRARRIEG